MVCYACVSVCVRKGTSVCEGDGQNNVHRLHASSTWVYLTAGLSRVKLVQVIESFEEGICILP